MFIVYNIPIKLIDFNNLQKKEIIANIHKIKRKLNIQIYMLFFYQKMNNLEFGLKILWKLILLQKEIIKKSF